MVQTGNSPWRVPGERGGISPRQDVCFTMLMFCPGNWASREELLPTVYACVFFPCENGSTSCNYSVFNM